MDEISSNVLMLGLAYKHSSKILKKKYAKRRRFFTLEINPNYSNRAMWLNAHISGIFRLRRN